MLIALTVLSLILIAALPARETGATTSFMGQRRQALRATGLTRR